MKFFDYVYYRACNWYKSKKEPNHHLMGVVIATLLLFSILFSLFTILTLLFFSMPKIEKWHSTIFVLIILSLMWYRYNKLVNDVDLDAKWGKENKIIKYRKGWLIVILLFISLFFPILIGFLRHNLGMNL